jgi:TonB family protein
MPAERLCYRFAMRKSRFVRPFYSLPSLCFALLIPFSLPALAQDASPALPTDPKSLILLAAKLNGLQGPEMKPWHLKASYTAYGKNGNHHGTYEEFWVSPSRFKVVITDSNSSQSEFGTEDGVFVAGKLSDTPDESSVVEEALSNPITADSTDADEVDQRIEKYGATELRCLYSDTPVGAIALEVTAADPASSESGTAGKSKLPPKSGPEYCLDSQAPSLRVIKSEAETVLRNGLSVFQGRYIARDIERHAWNNSPLLSVHIEVIEDLGAAAAPDFSLPVGAVLSKPKLRISGRLAREQALNAPAPVYPPIAKAVRSTGIVTIEAAVDTAGQVMNARVVSGPSTLCLSALDAVKHWTFKPYSINGQPVAFLATIKIRFLLK